MGILEELRDSIAILVAKIDRQSDEIAELREKVSPTRETYTLRQLAALPEAPAFKTLQSWRYHSPGKLPGGGKFDGFAHGGEGAWKRETVMAWRRDLAKHPGPQRGNPNLGKRKESVTTGRNHDQQ